MKKLLIFGILCVFLATILAAGYPLQKTINKEPLHRGTFEAEIGLRSDETFVVLEGNYRDFRRGHVLIGTMTTDESDRSIRFQGISTRNMFLIQSSVKNHIVNIFGRFTSYDEDIDEFSGQWKGFVVGQGRATGWITARFT